MSKWRNRWRRLIHETLSALPPGHTLRDARKALRAAYPFTREGWPYTVWCSEQRKALARYDCEPVTDSNRCGILLGVREGVPWISAVCDWCRGGIVGGCFLCLRHHLRLTDWLDDPVNRELRASSRGGDVVARAALADWYRERLQACDVEVM